MNWVTTNIRLPEDLYLELKMESVKKRKSLAQIARERLGRSKSTAKTTKKFFWDQLEKFSAEMRGKYPGLKLSEKLIDMRYEQ